MVKRISSGSPFEARIGYSRAVVDRDMVYVSGTTGYDYARMEMPEDAAAQTRNTLGTIEKALKEAGSGLQDIVRVRYYLTDMADVRCHRAGSAARPSPRSGLRPPWSCAASPRQK